MNAQDVLIVKRIIPALIEKQNQYYAKSKELHQAQLKGIFEKLLEVDSRKKEYVKEHAPHFNIFSIMRYGHYETRLHTPFLVSLLTPHGHHQLELHFFKLLIDKIYNKVFIESELSNIEVYEEFNYGSLVGRIDIFIKFKYHNEYYYTAIENKINADDQGKQLERYYKFLLTRTHNQDNICLVYLTKRGTNPEIPKSIEQVLYDKLIENNTLILLSYKGDISTWIRGILERKIPNSVSVLLQQYLQTINHF